MNLRIERYSNGWSNYKSVVTNYQITVQANGRYNFADIFNSKNPTVTSAGRYRVVAEVRDSKGSIINTANGPLTANYEFTVV